MSRSQRLRLRDTRALMSLQHELASVAALSEEWKTIVLEGIMKLVPAKFVLFGVMTGFRPNESPKMCDAAMAGSLSEEAQQVMGEWFERDDMLQTNPFLHALMGVKKQIFTHRRMELVDDHEWMRSEILNGAYQICEVQDNLSSFVRIEFDDRTCGISLHRHPSDPSFDRRERALLHLLNLALKPTFMLCTNLSRAPLSPRLEETLRFLLAGDSEKQVARRMGISHHTVHEYVKTIYQHFEVSSRAELMTICLDPGRRKDSFESR